MPTQGLAADADIPMPTSMVFGKTHGADPRWSGWALALLIVLAIFHIWYAGLLELQGDEAYYWLWSRRLDIGYYSKGPGIAAIIRFATAVAGDSERGVRWPAAVFSIGEGWLIFAIARRLFNARAAWLALLLALTAPLTWVGGFMMTIDTPSVFFWLLGAYAFLRALDSDGWGWWLGAGAAMALGALCKFTVLAQWLSMALALAFAPGQRRHLAGGKFWAMTAVALVGLAPPALWNLRHDWVTLRHLMERGALDQPFRPNFLSLAAFIGGQIAVFSPFYFAGLLWALFRRATWRSDRAAAFRWLAAFVLPLPLFYAAISLNGKSEPNWTAQALALAPVFLAGALQPLWAARPRLRHGIVIAIALHAALAAMAHIAPLTPAIYGEPPRFRRIGGARSLAAQTERWMRDTGAQFVVGGNYQTAALLSFYLPGRPFVYVPIGPRPTNQFFFWPSYLDGEAEPTRIGLYVGDQPLRPDFAAQFEKVEPLGEFWSEHQGRRLRRFHAARLAGLRTPQTASPKGPR